MKTVCIIPARMESSRFPGKPLKKLLGLPMINHIYRRCALSTKLDQVAVATCNQEIMDSVQNDNGLAIMTSNTHERCTDRIEEALGKIDLPLNDDDFVLMVQGDEIFIDPEMIDLMIDSYQKSKHPVLNVVSQLPNLEDCHDINTVKVVCDLHDNILFMSRSAIPSHARTKHHQSLQQTGIIGFQKKYLHKFSSLKQTPMEKIESVDMLRFLENGIKIRAIKIPRETIGIDTPEDFARAEKLLRTDPIIKQYLS